MRCSEIRGFNYDGSWGTSGLDLWMHHQHGTMAVEIARGKRYFPKWNVARWWLSQDAFQRNPERFLANFEAGLSIFAEHDIQVVPVLFNRWRDPVCDFGGVSLEHIVYGLSNMSGAVEDLFAYPEAKAPRPPVLIEKLHGRYLESVVGAHIDDGRIFAWDVCNEPLGYVQDSDNPIAAGELRWLTWCYQTCKRIGATQPLTIGNRANMIVAEMTEPISDVISVRGYYKWNAGSPDVVGGTKENFTAYLDACVDLADRTGKELFTSEAVWGALDDETHVEVMRYTLGELRKRDIGIIVHALHHSLVADLHYPAYGPVGSPECLHFVNADGSLRKGHEAFNEFC